MDCFRAIGTYSKHAKYNKCPDPLKKEKEFISHLYRTCESMKMKPVLIPTNDEWAYAISKHKEYLSKVSLPCVTEFETIKLLINKNVFYQIGQQNNYLTPKTWNINEHTNLNFPIVAKPIYRTISSDESKPELYTFLDQNRLTVIENTQELEAFLIKAGRFKDFFVLQEYIRGLSDRMYTVGIYADRHSNIKALFTGRKVRGYPHDIGDNIVGQNQQVPKRIIDNTYKIVSELGYTGIAEFEYKRDILTGEYRLIEINPRAWSWIGITPSCGVNIPLIAYKDMCGQQVPSATIQTTQTIRYIKIYQDLLNCIIRYRFSHPDWAMSIKSWRKELKQFITVYAELNKKDWPIAFMSVAYVIAKIIKRK